MFLKSTTDEHFLSEVIVEFDLRKDCLKFFFQPIFVYFESFEKSK